MNDARVLSTISEPRFTSLLVKNRQTAKDIAGLMLTAEKQSRDDAKRIAKFFKAPTVYGTCQRIFYFLKKHVPYEREPSDKQSAKTVSRIISDARKGYGNDCKHYATFAVSILKNLGINGNFRLVSFYENQNPTHAYAVAKDGAQTYIIDACLDYFDKETRYKRKYDIKPLN